MLSLQAVARLALSAGGAIDRAIATLRRGRSCELALRASQVIVRRSQRARYAGSSREASCLSQPRSESDSARALASSCWRCDRLRESAFGNPNQAQASARSGTSETIRRSR